MDAALSWLLRGRSASCLRLSAFDAAYSILTAVVGYIAVAYVSVFLKRRRRINTSSGSRRKLQLILCFLCDCFSLMVVQLAKGGHPFYPVLDDLPSSHSESGSGSSSQNCYRFSEIKLPRTRVSNPFNIIGTSLPFNQYAYLTTHNSFSIGRGLLPMYNQDDSITDQLNNGVRGLMLDVYDFHGNISLCHSFRGTCYRATEFVPAIHALREIEAFLSANPSEIVTLILEDHVRSQNGLSELFKKADLTKYMLPVSKMPQKGEDWPLVRDMIDLNQRLVVFTSIKSKQLSEGIAYQWSYMVENQYGDSGMNSSACYSRSESPELSDRTKSLVLVNYFCTFPVECRACMNRSQELMDVLHTCHAAAGDRWANFLAVDHYKTDGGGAFRAIDKLNGRLNCDREDVRACAEQPLQDHS